MKKSDLKQLIREALEEELDYSSRNQLFLDLSNEMVELQQQLEGLDFPTLFQNKFEEAGKKYRLGPLTIQTQQAIKNIKVMLDFLHRTEQ